MKILTLSVLLIVLVVTIEGKDLVVGTRLDNLLISTAKVVYSGIPLIRRDKDYIYTDPKQRIIKAIIARDLSRTKAQPEVTSGGVGATHVTIHFKSERGEGINYLVLIFGQNS